MKQQTIRLDLVPNISVLPTLNVKQYDYGERAFRFEIYDSGTAYTVPSGTLVTFQGTKPDKNGISVRCNFSGNIVTCNCTEQMTAIYGRYKAELRFRFADGSVGSADFIMNVARAGISDETKASNSEISWVEQTMKNAEKISSLVSQAQSASQSASSSASKASTSQKNALNSANNASKSEQNSKKSETNSANSEKNSKTNADNAQASATNAAGSASASKISEENAASSAQRARNYKTDAETAAQTASGYAGQAQFRFGRDPKTGRISLYHYVNTETE